MRIRRFVLIAVLGLAVACGGSGTSGARSTGSTTPTVSPSTTDGGTPVPAGSGGAPSSPKSSPKTSPAPTPTGTASPSAVLDKACVRRGASDDRQGLRVHTTPRGPYGYGTVYSDGSDITGHPEYDPDGPTGPIGGQGGSFADANGDAYERWIVPPSAPLGEATVTVNAAGTIFELKFTVVAKTGTCS